MTTTIYAPTLLVSFLFIDLVAYSKESTSGQQKIKTALITHLNAALKPLSISSYRVRDTGDGAFIAFLSNPEHPLYVALALWRACTDAGDEGQLPFSRLRVGINIGTVKEFPDVEGRSNYLGDGINSAKRVQDLAVPGQILASRSFFDTMSNLDVLYSKLFTPAGAGDDKHGRSHELYAVNFSQSAFSKLTREVQRAQVTELTPVDNPEPATSSGRMVGQVRQWFMPDGDPATHKSVQSPTALTTISYAPTLLISFLFIDLTSRAGESPGKRQKIKTALMDHLVAVLKPLPASHYRLHDTGDGAFVAFPNNPEHPLYVTLALWCACANVDEGGVLPFSRLRIGMNIGTVKEFPDGEGHTDYVGDGLSSAKLVQDLAQAGQVLASRSFFDAMSHLDIVYSRLFKPAGMGDDKSGRSHELYALHFEQTAFDKLTREVQRAQAHADAIIETPSSDPKTSAGRLPERVRQWLIPVSALFFSVTLFVNSMGQVTDPRLVLENVGLALLLLAMLMGLFSIGLITPIGLDLAAKFPRFARLVRDVPLMVVMLILGAIFLVLSWLFAHPEKPLATEALRTPPGVAEPVRSSNPMNPAPTPAVSPVPNQAPIPVPNVVASHPPEPTPMPITSPAAPITTPDPAPVVTPVPAVTPAIGVPQPPQPAAPRPASVEVRKARPEPNPKAKDTKVEPKTTILSARCSRLLEKVGSGEPLSAAEQNEMVSKCR